MENQTEKSGEKTPEKNIPMRPNEGSIPKIDEVPDKSQKEEMFPMRIPESQGDLADQANNQIEAELRAQIEHARTHRRNNNYGD